MMENEFIKQNGRLATEQEQKEFNKENLLHPTFAQIFKNMGFGG